MKECVRCAEATCPWNQFPAAPEHRRADAAGHALDLAEVSCREVTAISSEQLIAPLPIQHHLHGPRGLAGDREGRDRRGVGERLVVRARDVHEELLDPWADPKLEVIGPVALRYPCRESRLVEVRRVQLDGKGL